MPLVGYFAPFGFANTIVRAAVPFVLFHFKPKAVNTTTAFVFGMVSEICFSTFLVIQGEPYMPLCIPCHRK